ncbi:MAG: sigma 54-interacting transcriptional regulator [Myxococcota bacterium]
MSAREAPIDLTRDIRALAELAARPASLDDLMEQALEQVARVAPYDLATILTLAGEELVVRAARGPLSGRVREHRLALASFPSLRRAMEARRAKVVSEEEHEHGDGDLFDHVLDLPPGHACMVVPLCAADRCLGVMSLDRAPCGTFAPQVVDLVETYAQILALALHNTEQKLALYRVHQADRALREALEPVADGAVVASTRSPAVHAVMERARLVAETNTPVLLLGETGTGKERWARAIHHWSRRGDAPFVPVNCAAIPSSLLESELFGHVRGAFSGATRDRLGRFQMANGGTLFLDEVGELPLDMQSKLLRVLQEGELDPVGAERAVRVDVRVIAATHVDLERATRERTFRSDLYFRLNVFPLHLIPLRERPEDVETLAQALLAEQAQRTGRAGLTLSSAAVARLKAYSWPGNIRELSNVLERAAILARSSVIGPELLDVTAGPAEGTPLVARTLDEVQREHIQRVLAHVGGRIYGPGGAAEVLGLKPSTLQSRMQKLGLWPVRVDAHATTRPATSPRRSPRV